jgi:tetratricopeptide (TPR) repeat protein
MQHRHLLVVILLLGTALDAYAQTMSEAKFGNCTRSTRVAPEVRIRACEELAQSSFVLINNDELLLRKGQAYLDRGDYDRAILNFDLSAGSAVRNSKNPAEAYLHRGVAYGLQRKFAQARADIDEATRQLKLKSGTTEELMYRIKIVDGHLSLITNGVESPSVLREMLETPIHITHER